MTKRTLKQSMNEAQIRREAYFQGKQDKESELLPKIESLSTENTRLTADFRDSGNKMNSLMASNKDLHEQVAALESKEVCSCPHDDEIIEDCPYCKIEQLTAEVKSAFEAGYMAVAAGMKYRQDDIETAYRNWRVDTAVSGSPEPKSNGIRCANCKKPYRKITKAIPLCNCSPKTAEQDTDEKEL